MFFLQHSADVAYTKLLAMNINTGNHPPMASKPYQLALKHNECVHMEINAIEKADIIEKSLTPMESPILVITKKMEPGQLP